MNIGNDAALIVLSRHRLQMKRVKNLRGKDAEFAIVFRAKNTKSLQILWKIKLPKFLDSLGCLEYINTIIYKIMMMERLNRIASDLLCIVLFLGISQLEVNLYSRLSSALQLSSV